MELQAPPDEDVQRDFGPYYDYAEAEAVAQDWMEYRFVAAVGRESLSP